MSPAAREVTLLRGLAGGYHHQRQRRGHLLMTEGVAAALTFDRMSSLTRVSLAPRPVIEGNRPVREGRSRCMLRAFNTVTVSAEREPVEG